MLDILTILITYFIGEETAIIRGSWFFDGSWQPLESEYGISLEKVHLKVFGGKKYSDYYTDLSNKTPKTGKMCSILALKKIVTDVL